VPRGASEERGRAEAEELQGRTGGVQCEQRHGERCVPWCEGRAVQGGGRVPRTEKSRAASRGQRDECSDECSAVPCRAVQRSAVQRQLMEERVISEEGIAEH
jgi:hypothetical protein